jgi:Arc/MetJ family transcription regulator
MLDLDSDIAIFGSMKTTVDLPEAALAEAMKHTKAKTKTEAVARAVAEFNRRERMAALTRHLGTFKDFMTQADLKRMREDGRTRP